MRASQLAARGEPADGQNSPPKLLYRYVFEHKTSCVIHAPHTRTVAIWNMLLGLLTARGK